MDNIQGNRYLEAQGYTYDRTSGDLAVSAWHRKGMVRPGITPTEAADLLVADHEVHKYQAGYKIPGTQETPDKWVEVPGQFAIVRAEQHDSPEAWYAWASAEYRFMQMKHLFQALEPLAQVWPVETAGVLDNGRTVWIMFRVGGFDIRGDAQQAFFVVSEHLDARHSVQMFHTLIRVVCANTFQMALDSSILKTSVRHSGDVATDFADTAQLMTLLTARREEHIQLLQDMSFRIATPDEISAVVNYTLPMPKASNVLQQYRTAGIVNAKAEKLETDLADRERKVRAHRAAVIQELDLLNQELPDRANSLYNYTQAVAAWADHGFERRPDAASISTLYGRRASVKARATEGVVKLMKGEELSARESNESAVFA